MTLSSGTIARMKAKVAAMTPQERYDRAVAMTEGSEEHAVEFVKLLLGPDATEQDFMDMMEDLMAADGPR
jgi:hypothetical protein